MDAATIVKRIRALGGITRKELALLSGLAPSTVGRIERGELDPTWGTLSRILAATGYQLNGDSVVSAGDTSAVVAARPWLDAACSALQGASRAATSAAAASAQDFETVAIDQVVMPAWAHAWASTLESLRSFVDVLPKATSEWWERWQRAGWLRDEFDAEDLVTLAISAGNAAKISRRGNLQRAVAAPDGWQALARRFNQEDVEYSVSGLVAVRENRTRFDANLPVFYVDDPLEVASRLDLASALPGYGVLLVEANGGELDSVEVEGGIRFVPRSQAILDALAGSGREPDKAENELRKMLASA